MDKRKDFSIGEFSKIYFKESFKLAEKNLSSKEFDKKLRKNVSKKIKINEAGVKYLHHAFHWESFLKDNDSPIIYVSGVKANEKTRIKLKRNYSDEDVERMTKNLLKKYPTYLNARVEDLKNGIEGKIYE